MPPHLSLRWLVPQFPLRDVSRMAGIACAGAMLAGLYGALHDFGTFLLSPEYFTLMKFEQFQWANVGLPKHWFAAEIGFIAGASVGFFCGWFLARLAVPKLPRRTAWRSCVRGFIWVLGAATTGAMCGLGWGLLVPDDLSAWQPWVDDFGITDVRSFARVAHVHFGSYVGALAGLIVACAQIVRLPQRRD